MRVSLERFEELVFEEAEHVLAQLPSDLRAEAESVVLLIEHQAADGRRLLGLYEGVPLVDRHVDSTLLQPDRITLFHGGLQSLAHTETELRRQIRKTLIHELGHFFGFDEAELRRRGWG
jgi:predicted Zn-dependent protease with MMP-like domain